MRIRTGYPVVVLALASAISVGEATAQAFPSKVVRLVVAYPAVAGGLG
jgi:hypothetical protein